MCLLRWALRFLWRKEKVIQQSVIGLVLKRSMGLVNNQTDRSIGGYQKLKEAEVFSYCAPYYLEDNNPKKITK